MGHFSRRLFFDLFILTLFLLSQSLALYNENSFVKKLNLDQFNKKILSTNKIFLVEFYQDWCGHCKNFAPTYEKVAQAFDGIIPVIATDDQAVISKFEITGFPTIKLIIAKNGNPPEAFDYNDNRDASSLISFTLKTIKGITKERLKDKNNTTKDTKKEKTKQKDSSVHILTDLNFKNLVVDDINHHWFIEFYAPWCGHCKNLAPIWEEFANTITGPIKVGKVDATTEKDLANKFMIKGYPTLKFLPIGQKSENSAKTYEGPRNVENFKEFAFKFSEKSKTVEYLESDDKFREVCQNKVCIVSFLPRASNPDDVERNKYLDEYKSLAKMSSDLPINFLWAQGGDHYQVEQQLNLFFGYPAVVAFSLPKSTYIIHRGGFTIDSLNSFLTGLVTGQLPSQQLPVKLNPFGSVTLSSQDLDANNLHNEL